MATNWGEIHTLQARLKYHEIKYHYRRGQLAKWDKAEKTATHWHNKKALLRAQAEAEKWNALIRPEAQIISSLEKQIKALMPKKQLYHAGGWVKPGSPFSMQRSDQGQDFQIPKYTAVIAPAAGKCIQYAYDGPFPNGFGSPYAVVQIDSGPFHNAPVNLGLSPTWYLGHANRPLIRPGESFHEGQPLAILNNGFSSYWGWIEVGHWFPGGMTEGYMFRSLFDDVWK